MNGDTRHFATIATFCWRQDAQRLRPVNVWY
jgi:hypothetical protein